jgi:AraC-like DNA-binding protein
MSLGFELDKPSIAISYLQLLLEIGGERGLAPEAMLAGVPVSPELLHLPGARMSPVQWALAVSRAMTLCGEPGLGYECGLRMRPTVNGFLGYATMSCGSMREAMELAARYIEARQRGFAMRLSRGGGYAIVEVRQNHPIPALRAFFYEHILVGVARGAAAILGIEPEPWRFEGVELWFDWPEPPYHARYAARLPPVRFSRGANLLRFPERMLELKPVLADPQASRQAIELCERELAQLGGAGDSIVLRVCAELVAAPQGGYPDQETVAARLHLSSRSLVRRLREDGSGFQQLLDEARRRDACELIERSPLRLAEIAARLGYTNPANFTRAFRKWTGESPSEYRRRLGPGWAAPARRSP